MMIHSCSRHRGAVYVFVLMGLIALLALTVVFISRAGRDEPGQIQVTEKNESVPQTEDTSLTDEASTSTFKEPAAIEAVRTPEPVVPPPPVTPIPTANPQSLPPEG